MHIVVEGQDATGKDTQAKLLAEYLKSQGQQAIYYAESGTASKDEFLRTIGQLNYGADYGIDDKTHALLYLVNRYEQWKRLAEPTLKAGGVVVTARSWLSTLIYSGYAKGVSKSSIVKMHKAVLPDRYFKPDKIVILTLSDAERAERLKEQKRTTEFWKSKSDKFQQKLNKSYLEVAKKYEIPTLSAAGPIEEVHKRLVELFGL